jgi:hypothetical protein
MNGAGQKLIHQFCDMYEHARHDPNEFADEEYQAYYRLLMKLIDAAKMLKTFTNSRQQSPNHRTPVKKQIKMQSLLDPARLRPPMNNQQCDTMTPNARINLSLGLGLQDHLDDHELGENEILSISQYHGDI